MRLADFVRRLLLLEFLSSGWTAMRLDITGFAGESTVEPTFHSKQRLTDRAALIACLIDRGTPERPNEFRPVMAEAWPKVVGFALPFEQAVTVWFRRLPVDPDNLPATMTAARKAAINAATPAQKKAMIAARKKAIAEKDPITLMFERVIESLVPPEVAAQAGWRFFRGVENPTHLLIGRVDPSRRSRVSKFVSDLDTLVRTAADKAPASTTESDDSGF